MDHMQIAANRFGLGARAYDRTDGDAAATLKAQLGRFVPGLPGIERLATRADIVGRIADYQAMQAAARQQMKMSGTAPAPAAPAAPAPPTTAAQPMAGAAQAPVPSPMAVAPPAAPVSAEMRDQRQDAQAFVRDQYTAQIGLRLRSAIASDTPFVERLVHFWANHFAVSADKLELIALAGLMEFEAIRPHVLGKFEDMLLAVEQHPAMLFYLDQSGSIGPDSAIGTRSARNGRPVGLNENLGREILELHTLGVRTGYSQADVTEFARALTGWTVAGIGRGKATEKMASPPPPGDFLFLDAMHQPGTRNIVGKSYDQPGVDQARAVLVDLARHPATARHVATKLARHFVADDPSPTLVARLEKAYLATNGDLPTVYRALIEAPDAWDPAPAKFRTPWLWGTALFRSTYNGQGTPFPQVQDRSLSGLFNELGQPVWRPGSPAGYDDIAASWAAPDALYRRVEAAGRVAGQAPAGIDARSLATRLFGDRLSVTTRDTIARADSPRQGLALLMVAPEMMRC